METVHLDHGVRAPRHARRWIVQHCHDWGCDELADTAALMLNELVTNVFLHAGTDCLIRAGFEAPILAVTVSDEDRTALSADRPPDTAESGRGLAIIAALAHSWGIHHHGNAKSVWFQLSTDDYRPRVVPPSNGDSPPAAT